MPKANLKPLLDLSQGCPKQNGFGLAQASGFPIEAQWMISQHGRSLGVTDCDHARLGWVTLCVYIESLGRVPVILKIAINS